MLPLQCVDRLHKQEYRQPHDDEGHQRIDEHADVQSHGARLLRRVQRRVGPGLRARLQHEKQIGEVGLTQGKTDRRHDDVLDQGIDDLAERGADHDAHGEIDDVAPDGKLAEFV